MPDTRDQICGSTAQKLRAAAATVAELRAVVGLDGFVDEIIAVVATRHSDGHYDAIETIAEFGAKVSAAAGESTNYELVTRRTKLGGNGPIMANALASLGVRLTYIGNLGYPEIHPAFADLAARSEVISIAEPGHTDALEFADGKIMLGKLEPLRDVDWKNLEARVGRDRLSARIEAAAFLGMVNWTMLPGMSEIWEKLLAEILPTLPGRRSLFVDLADPEKRTARDILEGLNLIARFQSHADVILGLNLKESQEISHVLGISGAACDEAKIADSADAIRAKLGISCVVIHPRRAAAAATESETAWFAGPFVRQPAISTGAGDHFNSGFCLGRLVGLTLEESLCAGVGTSGYYVRTAESPSLAALAEFVAALPPAE